MKPAGQQSCKNRKKLSLHKKTFFINAVCPVKCFAPAKTVNVMFLVDQFYMEEDASKRGGGHRRVCTLRCHPPPLVALSPLPHSSCLPSCQPSCPFDAPADCCLLHCLCCWCLCRCHTSTIAFVALALLQLLH
jgi:hypothetical protein